MKALFVISLFISTLAFSQNKVDLTNSKEILIGEWKFVKVIDKDGNEIKKIESDIKVPDMPPIVIKASGPDIIINKDGTYTKIFTPKNSDTGNWRIKSKNEVEYEMVIPMESKSGKMIIETQKVMPTTIWRKDDKGNFLDASSDKIMELSKTVMKVSYEKKYLLVYKKVIK